MNNPTDFLKNIQINAHSSIRIQAGDAVLYVDPFRLTAAPHDADLIFLTHSHFDHFSPEDVDRVRKSDTVFILPESARADAAENTQGHRVVGVQPYDRGSVLRVEYEAVPAYNPGKPFHPRANNWVGYVLTVEGLRIYIAGDTDRTPEAEQVSCDIALLPIGGKYTMDAVEAAALANLLRPQVAVPIHYGSVAGELRDFDRFAAAVDPAIRVERLV